MPADFYDLTWSQYQRACLGYRIRLDRGWDYTRNLMATQIGSMGGKTKPNEIYRCVFDPIIEPLILSPEEWERIKIAWNIKPQANA
jgi:hypothetical protein